MAEFDAATGKNYDANSGNIAPWQNPYATYVDVPGRGRVKYADLQNEGYFKQFQGQAGPSAPMADVAGMAKQLHQFQVDANQPAIQTLQGSVDPLKERYSKLLDSIKGQGQVAVDQQTLATANELGKRGILPSSGLFQQEQANALRPVTAQYQGLTAQTGLAEQQDIQGITDKIAGLQAGNPVADISAASSIFGVQQGAQNVQAQIAGQLQQTQMQTNAQLQAAKLANQYKTVNPGDYLFNAATNSLTPTGSSFGGVTQPPRNSFSGSSAPPQAPKQRPDLRSLFETGA